MMRDSSVIDQPILRIWYSADAPAEFRSALLAAGFGKDYWIAHVPRDLMDEPVLSLLRGSALPPNSVESTRLSDGSALFAGPFSPRQFAPETNQKALFGAAFQWLFSD